MKTRPTKLQVLGAIIATPSVDVMYCGTDFLCRQNPFCCVVEYPEVVPMLIHPLPVSKWMLGPIAGNIAMPLVYPSHVSPSSFLGGLFYFEHLGYLDGFAVYFFL